MKRLTKEQQSVRDADIDWKLAQAFRYANGRDIWADFSPTSDWAEAGRFIEEFEIDIRFFSKEMNPKLEYEWMGGLQRIDPKTNLMTYYTAFGPTPLIAAMKALVSTLHSQD